jgi:hypothetical protein
MKEDKKQKKEQDDIADSDPPDLSEAAHYHVCEDQKAGT